MPSATASLTEPLDLVLHIGTGKAGSSSIQFFLRDNRERLGELGVLFPQSPGRGRHDRLSLFITPDAALDRQFNWHNKNYSSSAEFRENFRHKLFAEINSSGLTRMLLSDEGLYGASVEALKRLRAFTEEIARSIRAVVYLRRQDEHMVSRYQQVVKMGEVRRLAERLEEMNFTKNYDYHARLRSWQRLMEPTEFVVRPFERERFVDGSLLQDFLDAVRIDVRAEGLKQVPNVNKSLDAESVEFLRLLNLYRVEHEGATPGLIDNRALVKRLTELSTGPTLTLPARELDAFMEQWEEPNRAVAREFLGDQSGRLFRAPRKTRNTTNQQRLDPARLDHFITVLELPEQMHSPLRRLVERETKAAETPTGVRSRSPNSMRWIRRASVPRATHAPTTSPLSRPLDLTLHIGTGKAGSSSIQFFLRDNRERLGELGVLYPRTPGQARHARLGLFVKPETELENSPEWYQEKQTDPASFRKAFQRRLFLEIEDSGLSRVLLSDEILFGSSEQTLRRLSRFTHRIAESLRLVAYFRRQDDHMVSRYQQGVKIGWVARLRDWAHEDMSSLYDYHARIRTHERLLAPTDFVVRRFEPESFVDGSLLQDFLDAVRIDARAEKLNQGPNVNESLDAESVEFLRLLNIYRVEHEGATPGLIDNRALAKRLTEFSTGPTLTLPARELDAFMKQWEEPNRAVAREFLGDPSGQLFRAPRKTRNTTTQQCLDPARLEHFITLVELPEQLHSPLRRLVERETKAG